MNLRFIFVTMLLVVFGNINCNAVEQAAKKNKAVIGFFDFESELIEGCTINSQYASITDNPAEVISGKKSLKLDTTKTKNSLQALFNTVGDSVPLKPKARYLVSFDYKTIDVNTADSFFYVTIAKDLDLKGVESDYGSIVRFRENYKDNRQEMKFVSPSNADDFKLYIGIFNQGKIILDDIKITELPNIDVTAEGVEVPSEKYEPYGICAHFERIPGYGPGEFSDAEVAKSIKMLKHAGIQWLRVHVLWGKIEPNEGQINKTQLDRIDFIVDTALAKGIKPYIHFVFQPKWVSEEPNSTKSWGYCTYAPKDMSKWADYVEMMAKRYKGKVRYWEINNEIDWVFWCSSLEKYQEFLKVAYQTLKKVDPQNKVIMAGLAGDGVHTCWNFSDCAKEHTLQKLYDAGVKDYFDIFATHPYALVLENSSVISVDKINTTYEIMERNGDGHKPIWLTELGASTHDLGSKEAQAEYIKKVYTEVIKHPKIDKIFWYNFRCKSGESDQQENFGIVNADLSPRPAYEMLKSLPKTKVKKVNCQLLED